MLGLNHIRRACHSLLFKAVLPIVFLIAYINNSSAQNPNSDTTTTGQILTVNITSPTDGSMLQGPPPCEVTVEGLVTLSSLPDTAINLLYVMDLSGSTSEFGIVPLNIPPIDVNGDGVVDAGDDFNGDGFSGDILDAEIGAALALNLSIGDLDEVDVGIIAYASHASNADVSPQSGMQMLTSSPLADEQPNGLPDIEEVLRSLDSDSFRGGSIGLFTPVPESFLGSSTNFEAALQTLIAAFDTQPEGEKNIAFFLSDGFRTSGGTIDDEIAQAAAKGIVINTIGITEFSDAEELSAIAEGTGGTFIQVIDPKDLVADIVKITPVKIAGLTVNGAPVSLSAAGTFSTNLSLPPGPNTIAATATADDSTKVTASISVHCPAEAFTCQVEIISPQDGALICGDSVNVTAVTSVSGGIPPITSECRINDVPAELVEDTLSATIPLEAGVNFIAVVCVFTDAQNNQISCTDTVQVQRAELPVCQVDIISPQDSVLVCADSVKVTAVTTITGGTPPLTIMCDINGVVASVSDTMFMATVPLSADENTIIATCTIIDSCGSETVCRDSIRVFRAAAPTCIVEIISPEDSAVVRTDSVTVMGLTRISGGVPPLDVTCEVNGIAASVTDSMFMAVVPLSFGKNTIIAECTVVDSCGNQAVCSDTICVFREAVELSCQVEIISPEDSTVVCDDSVKVTGVTSIIGGLAPIEISCEVNGFAATVSDTMFMATVPLSSGDNLMVATCTVVDSLGNLTVCGDSINIFFDDIAPTCTFTKEGLVVKGTFFDEHSGIASIAALSISNGILTVDPFTPGDKSVNFRIDPINPNKRIGFNIEVTDGCGNIFICDPILLSLSADAENRQSEFTFPSTDRYFILSNHGLSEIRVDLNGNKFKLLSDPSRAQQEFHAYPMPAEGTLILDLHAYLTEDENNMFIVFDGDRGTSAELMLIDFAQNVDYVLELETLPVQFQLTQNYPNPFNPTTKIQFDLPAKLSEGVQVHLRIYNLLGELIRVLVNEHKFPGQYLVEWDGKDKNGRAVSSGIYLYQLVAAEFKQTKRMILLK